MKRLQQEINIIGISLMTADDLGIIEKVQEIFRPFILKKESIDLDTICNLESLLKIKLVNICPTDKEIRKLKLDKLKIVAGKIIPKTAYLKIDEETGLVYIKLEK